MSEPEPGLPEPWLRGIQLDVDPIVAPVLFALQQVREDLSSIHVGDIWMHGPRIPSLGFQLSHIAGSVDRLTTYLEARELSESQLEYLGNERMPGRSLGQLMAQVESALDRAEAVIRAIDPATYPGPRYVGRRKLPTTVIGLIIHIAEHTQRHCGQAITTAKLMNPDL
jgi:DinB superfamily